MVWNWSAFHEHLWDKAKSIAPDYPNINENDDPWELLWAITSTCQGTNLANDDLHELIEELRNRLGLSRQEVYEISCNLQKQKDL